MGTWREREREIEREKLFVAMMAQRLMITKAINRCRMLKNKKKKKKKKKVKKKAVLFFGLFRLT